MGDYGSDSATFNPEVVYLPSSPCMEVREHLLVKFIYPQNLLEVRVLQGKSTIIVRTKVVSPPRHERFRSRLDFSLSTLIPINVCFISNDKRYKSVNRIYLWKSKNIWQPIENPKIFWIKLSKTVTKIIYLSDWNLGWDCVSLMSFI